MVFLHLLLVNYRLIAVIDFPDDIILQFLLDLVHGPDAHLLKGSLHTLASSTSLQRRRTPTLMATESPPCDIWPPLPLPWCLRRLSQIFSQIPVRASTLFVSSKAACFLLQVCCVWKITPEKPMQCGL